MIHKLAATLMLFSLSVSAGFPFAQRPERASRKSATAKPPPGVNEVEVHQSVRNDLSQPLSLQINARESLAPAEPTHTGLSMDSIESEREETEEREENDEDAVSAPQPVPAAAAAVEQKSHGTRAPAQLVESFDGL